MLRIKKSKSKIPYGIAALLLFIAPVCWVIDNPICYTLKLNGIKTGIKIGISIILELCGAFFVLLSCILAGTAK